MNKAKVIQCIRCINQKSIKCKDNDKLEKRECNWFIPRTEDNKLKEDIV